MKIAFVGKGGSGKSSVSWLIAKQAAAESNHVLAIDADYNMDLAHNLGWNQDKPARFFNHAEPDLLPRLQLGDDEPWNAMLTREFRPEFSLSPPDVFTKAYSQNVDTNLDLMIWGPPHEDLLYGSRCSHAYIAPIKFYLPFLKTGEREMAMVDSVAGTDMVSYGLYLGVDAVVCVVEGTRQSIGVYQGIKKICDEFGIPLFVLFNKAVGNTYHRAMTEELGDRLLGAIGVDPAFISLQYDECSDQTKQEASNVLARLREKRFDPELAVQRMKRWKHQLDNATQLH